ncbi:PstS family phosphate ABC transporter substrate-binding protein [Thermosediminibacter oceani]|uniref:Phosphate-binding protein n=1 Tax=Thermosediminibacter oceani (strain ATCC BAA-1034 / DSM 16646 / JW/IW-1228P) TaxID=555079 RepID=D9S0X1_THEOJ|nr:PstS family phosphate ABC transporter substrate-binding protein [Thermosediminibacter oceani]ADL07135.1 phosphate ABC transporter substrate-binding protein, PhoT family [Thermosediminibacter oceani DSM 16646]
MSSKLKGAKAGYVLALFTLSLAAVLVVTACGASNRNQGGQANLSGSIEIDGSSTVYPITEAVAEEFMNTYPDVNITVGVSGTGGGFKRFTAGETDISNASRPISDEEAAKAKESGVEYIELPVAYDGITVVVNKENDWVDHLTVEELKKIWSPGSKVTKWSDIRPGWPDEKINLYGPGTDSGTFEYFTEAVNGEAKKSRSDYTASEDDNVLVQGVSGDRYALGYFGFAYYLENSDKVKAVPIDGGSGPVEPTAESIKNGTYKPLARPIFIYVNKKSLERPEVKEFVKFYMENAAELVEEVGFVPMPESEYQENLNKIE